MAIAHHADTGMVREEIAIRKLGLHDLSVALSQGWEDFQSKRGDLVFIGLIYPVVVALAGFLTQNARVLPLIFPLAAGSILLSPAIASGFYEMARRREEGLDSRWRHYFDVVHGPAALSLLALTCVTALLYGLWVGAAWYIYSKTLAPLGSPTLSAFVQALFITPEGHKMVVIGNFVGLGFATLTLAISAVSFPMLVDKRVGWLVAMRTSFRVAWKNPFVIAVWGLIIVGLLVLGSLPAFIGLAVVLPVLGYATWHLYTRAVAR